MQNRAIAIMLYQSPGTFDDLVGQERKLFARNVGTWDGVDACKLPLALADRLTFGDADWNDFLNRYFDSDDMPICDGAYDKINYSLLNKKENQVILNLARLEHMRWNASHEMLGYVKAHDGLHSCDERTRKHNCLRPWQELDEEGRTVTKLEGWQADYKRFDFSVVDNSILLNKEKLSSNENK